LPKCIFCKSTTGPFNTREHILPESLGGEDWALLPDGLLCDACQNLFGSSVEQQALGSYPFNQLRVLFQIPTKKRKATWFQSSEGILKASSTPNLIEYEPPPQLFEALKEGRKSQIRVLAEPKRPDMICRFLLKMGLEVVSSDGTGIIFNKKYDPARKYALLGEKSSDWWYLQRENITTLNEVFRTRVKPPEWADPVKLEVATFDNGAEVFHFKLFYLDILTPLLPDTILSLDKEPLNEPEYRLFKV
jgi:hypothetical protein